MSVALAVIAKEPVAGRVKTRLCPPCTPEQAAALAASALADTLQAVAATPATRRIVVLDGEPGDWLPAGFEIIPQVGGGLDARLAAAFRAVAEPLLLIGMDTPQVSPALLGHAVSALESPGVDAALGFTEDGGYWGIGLRHSHRELFHGVPMSQDDTGSLQHERLLEHGLVVDASLPVLIDIDDITAARSVAAEAPSLKFSRMLRDLALSDSRDLAAATGEPVRS